MTYKIILNTDNLDAELESIVAKLKSDLTPHFGGEYEISSDSLTLIEENKTWSHSINIRKGMTIGASVDLNWEAEKPNELIMSVEESTKLGNTILSGSFVSFFSIGVILGYFNIAPFDFLPGKKLAGFLAGLIMLIPGIIIAFTLKNLLLKKFKNDNLELQNSVRNELDLIYEKTA
jgi:hypothetical protein